MEEEDKSLIDVREMSLKCTSKREVYKVLSITGNVYLPPESQINSDFIRDILSGDKLVCHLCYSVVFNRRPSQDYKCSSHRRTQNSWYFIICRKICRHK